MLWASFGITLTLTGASSLEPSGYLTLTGIVTLSLGTALSGEVTVTVPVLGSTVAVQPSGKLPSGISNTVLGGNWLSPVCGISIVLPGLRVFSLSP